MSDEERRPDGLEDETAPPARPPEEDEEYGDEEEDEGLDPRVLAVVGIIVLLIVVIYWRRSARSDEDALPVPPSHEAREERPEPRPPTYEELVMQRQSEALQYVYRHGGRTLAVARPPIPPRPGREEGETLPAKEGEFFDITSLPEGVAPAQLYRRLFGHQHAFKDMLPALGTPGGDFAPRFAPASEVGPQTVGEDEPVCGILVGGEAKAYPAKFLHFHEVVNDEAGGKPVVLFYNAVARAFTAFERIEHDGAPLAFGSSGLLFRGASLAYDAATRSLWNGMTGEAVSGEMFGEKLPRVHLALLRYGAWKEKHPGTLVMVGTEPETPVDYGPDYAVGVEHYHGSPMIIYPLDGFEDDQGHHPKTSVIGVLAGGSARAYAAYYLEEIGRIEDEIGGVEVVVELDPNSGHVEARAADGELLHSQRAYWLAWQAAHPGTDILPKPDEEDPAPWTETAPLPPEEAPPLETQPFDPGAPLVPDGM